MTACEFIILESASVLMKCLEIILFGWNVVFSDSSSLLVLAHFVGHIQVARDYTIIS